MDVANIPAEKEARFREQLISSRLQRSITKWKVRLGRFFGFLGGGIAKLFQWLYKKLIEAKKSYSLKNVPATPVEKEDKVKELFAKNEAIDNRESFEEKEANLIKIIELDARSAQAFEDLGQLYFANKKYEEAKQALAHVLKLLGDEETDREASIYSQMSSIYQETKEGAEALETIKMAVKLSPNNPKYLDSLAEISIMNKDKTSALGALEKLAQVNPENGKLAELAERVKELE